MIMCVGLTMDIVTLKIMAWVWKCMMWVCVLSKWINIWKLKGRKKQEQGKYTCTNFPTFFIAGSQQMQKKDHSLKKLDVHKVKVYEIHSLLCNLNPQYYLDLDFYLIVFHVNHIFFLLWFINFRIFTYLVYYPLAIPAPPPPLIHVCSIHGAPSYFLFQNIYPFIAFGLEGKLSTVVPLIHSFAFFGFTYPCSESAKFQKSTIHTF